MLRTFKMNSIPSKTPVSKITRVAKPVDLRAARVAKPVDLKRYFEKQMASFKKLTPIQKMIAIQEVTPYWLAEDCMAPTQLEK